MLVTAAPCTTSSALAGLSLLVPAHDDWTGGAVADAWRRQGGRVRPVDRYWAARIRRDPGLRLYGPDIFCRTLAARLDLALLAPRDEILAALPPRLLGRRVRVGRLGDLARGRRRFVKPVEPKLFRAQVVAGSAPILRAYSATRRDTPVLVADVVAFEAEVRVFVLDGRVAAAAAYRGQAATEDALPAVRELLAWRRLPRAWVVDVGRLSDGRWAVVEFNAVHAAHAYACDPESVARCVAAASGAQHGG